MRRASAARTSIAREAGQKARQHVNHCGRERKALFVVALADDQQVVAPIDRPHAVGVQVGQTRPGRLSACASAP